MSYYEILTFLHVAAAIIWLGAGFLVVVLIFGAERAGDMEKEAGHHRDVVWLAPRLFIPASLSALLLGILLVLEGAWEFNQLWILIALAGWAVSFLLGILYFKPEGERIGALVEARGPGDPEAERRLRRLNAVDRLQVSVLFLIVLDMVFKPTGGDGLVLTVGAVLLATAVASAAPAVLRSGGGEVASTPAEG